MTNEEKFRAGKVLYKNDEGNYVLELWARLLSTPTACFIWKILSFHWADRNDPKVVEGQIFQWLLECASKLTIPFYAKDLAQWTLDNYANW